MAVTMQAVRAMLQDHIEDQVQLTTLANKIRPMLQAQENQGIEITDELKKAIAIKAAEGNGFEITNLNNIIDDLGLRPQAAAKKMTFQERKTDIQARLAKRIYEISESSGYNFQEMTGTKRSEYMGQLYDNLQNEIRQASNTGGEKKQLEDYLTRVFSSSTRDTYLEDRTTYLTRKAGDIVLGPTERFRLMAKETARRAIETERQKSDSNATASIDDTQVEQLAKMIENSRYHVIKRGKADVRIERWQDFQWANTAEMDKTFSEGGTVTIKMLHECPLISNAAASLVEGKTLSLTALTDQLASTDGKKYVFGRDLIVKDCVKTFVTARTKGAEKIMESITNNPYLTTTSAKRTAVKANAGIDPKFMEQLRQEIISQLLDNHVVRAVSATGTKITIEDLAAKFSDPVGRDLLDAAIASSMEKKITKLEKQKGNWFGALFSQKMAKAMGLKSAKLAATIAQNAVKHFMAFDPLNHASVQTAIALKSQTKKSIEDKAGAFDTAARFVDFMLIHEMRQNRNHPDFDIQSNVRKHLVEYLLQNPDLDHKTFLKAVCDKFEERVNVNKTFKFAHFYEKGNRASGLLAWPGVAANKAWTTIVKKFSGRIGGIAANPAGFEAILHHAKTVTTTGKQPDRTYNMHRDAAVALDKAIEQFNKTAKGGKITVNGKQYDPVSLDAKVRSTLEQQIIKTLEKARLDGKRISLDHIVSSLEAGMKALVVRDRDSKGVITASSVMKSMEDVTPTAPHEKPNTRTTTSLDKVCSMVINAETTNATLGKMSLKSLGMTTKTAVTYAMSGIPKGCTSKVRKNIEESLLFTLNHLKHTPITQNLLDELKTQARTAVKHTKKVLSGKRVTTPESWSADTTTINNIHQIGQRYIALTKEETESRTAAKYKDDLDAIRNGHVAPNIRADKQGIKRFVVTRERTTTPETLLPKITSAVALFEFIVANGKDDTNTEIINTINNMINDPKNADTILNAQFNRKNLVECLLAHPELKIVTAVYSNIEKRRKELVAAREACPDKDIVSVAETLQAIKGIKTQRTEGLTAKKEEIEKLALIIMPVLEALATDPKIKVTSQEKKYIAILHQAFAGSPTESEHMANSTIHEHNSNKWVFAHPGGPGSFSKKLKDIVTNYWNTLTEEEKSLRESLPLGFERIATDMQLLQKVQKGEADVVRFNGDQVVVEATSNARKKVIELLEMIDNYRDDPTLNQKIHRFVETTPELKDRKSIILNNKGLDEFLTSKRITGVDKVISDIDAQSRAATALKAQAEHEKSEKARLAKAALIIDAAKALKPGELQKMLADASALGKRAKRSDNQRNIPSNGPTRPRGKSF